MVARKMVAQMWADANERIQLASAKDLAEEVASSDILLLDVRLPTTTLEDRTIDALHTPSIAEFVDFNRDVNS